MAGKFDHLLGKHLSIVSKAGARYTGIFVGADPVESTITLRDIYFHGTEDRPVPKKAPGGQRLEGPVSFKTPSIVKLEEATDHPPAPVEEAFVDPALPANISLEPPKAAVPPPALKSSPNPPRDSSADSAATALDRVQESLSQLSTGPPAGPSRGRGRGGFHQQQSRPAPAVPDTEFDFSGTAAFASQREKDTARAQQGEDGIEDLGELEDVNPAAISAASPPIDGDGAGPAQGRKGSQSQVYEKDDFFDNLSGANEKRGAGRTNRNVEREKNLDAFGDAGDSHGGPMGGPRGGMRGMRIGFAGRGAVRGGGGYSRGGGGPGGYGSGGGGYGGRGGGYGGGGGAYGGPGGERRGGFGGRGGGPGEYGGQRDGGFGGEGDRPQGQGGFRGRGRGGYQQRENNYP